MRHLVSAICLFAALIPAHAQQMDMDAMMKWGTAAKIRYHIVGVYQDRTYIAGDGTGRADVSDRVVIDLMWNLPESKLIGQPTFQNFKTTVTNVTDIEPKCLPPVLKGDYEHYDVLGIKDGLSGAIEIQVKTTYPVVEVVQMCTGSRKAVPGKVEVAPEEFTVISPVTFAMPLPDSDELRISTDKKSLIAKKGGWTWTYTPTALPAK